MNDQAGRAAGRAERHVLAVEPGAARTPSGLCLLDVHAARPRLRVVAAGMLDPAPSRARDQVLTVAGGLPGPCQAVIVANLAGQETLAAWRAALAQRASVTSVRVGGYPDEPSGVRAVTRADLAAAAAEAADDLDLPADVRDAVASWDGRPTADRPVGAAGAVLPVVAAIWVAVTRGPVTVASAAHLSQREVAARARAATLAGRDHRGARYLDDPTSWLDWSQDDRWRR